MTTSPTRPLVSVLMPSTGRDTLWRAVSSVMDQTIGDWELLIGLNNTLPYYTGDQYATIGQRIRRFNYGVQPQDSGTTVRMMLLAEAKGEYIATLDDDDYWEADFLNLMLLFMENAKVDLAYCGSALLSKKTGEKLGYWYAPFDAERLAYGNFILSNTILARREVWEQVPLRPEAGYNSDWNWYLRVSRAGFKIAHYAAFLSNARVNEGVWNYWGPGFEPFSKEEDHTWIAS